MELRDLRVFLAVVEARSFTAAGRRVHTVQSAVSDAVARLERELGVTLVDRRRGGLMPTPAGEALTRWAALILNSAERAGREIESFRTLSAGSIRLGLLPTITPIVLPELLTALRRRHPNLKISVQEGLAPDLLDRLSTAALDLVVLFFPAEQSPELAFVEVARRPLSVIVPSHHPLRGRRTMRLEEAAQEDWITYPPYNPGRLWLDRACQAAGFSPRVAAEVETPMQQQIFVEAGAGIAMVPFGRRQARRPGAAIQALRLEPPVPDFRVGYAYHPRIVNPALGAALEALQGILATPP